MATVDLRVGGGNSIAGACFGAAFALEKIIDFSESSASSGDILQLCNIPVGSFVQGVAVKVETAEGAALTADIGDYDADAVAVDADGYHDGVDLNSAAVSSSAPGVITVTEAADVNTVVETPAYCRGKFYAAAGILSLLLNNDASAAKITVTIFGFKPV